MPKRIFRLLTLSTRLPVNKPNKENGARKITPVISPYNTSPCSSGMADLSS